MINGQLEELA